MRIIGSAALMMIAAAIPIAASASLTAGRFQVARAESLNQRRRIDVNQINMFVTNFGSFAYDLSTFNAGLIYPRGTQKTAVFDAGLWLGCTVGGQVRAVVAEYSQEYGPGQIVGSASDDHQLPQYKVYKVVPYGGVPNDTAEVFRSAADLAADPLADPIVHHSWSDYIRGAKPYGAPTRIWRLPNTATPAPDDSVDVEGPDVLGDQMLWCVYNDADASRHTNPAGRSSPLGVEIQQIMFGFNRPGPLGNVDFIKYRIINKGLNVLDNMYVSLWSDPDLGGFTDDLVGCDTTLALGFCYNADNNDAIYGSSPPAAGYALLRGPVNRAIGDTLSMTSFNKYIGGTDPSSPDQTYNYMQSLNPDGTAVIDPTTGLVTRFTNSGDPVASTGWLDSNPADRRLMLSSGPFQMVPGDTQEVVAAIVIGQGRDRLTSVTAMKFNDTFVRNLFAKDFVPPMVPVAPSVTVSTAHDTIKLIWDDASRSGYHDPAYSFEGFNVYQGASASGPWTRVATYDEIDGIKVIVDDHFDPAVGDIVNGPVAFGDDTGLQYSHTASRDTVRGTGLIDDSAYYFAVSAYAYAPAGIPKVVESQKRVVRAIPQRPPLGTNPATASATPVTHLQKNPARPQASDRVSVSVMDPNRVTGHIYKVVFNPTVPLFHGPIAGDTATVLNSWSVIDSTTGSTVIGPLLDRRGTQGYPVVDGISVSVLGNYFPLLRSAHYLDFDPYAYLVETDYRTA